MTNKQMAIHNRISTKCHAYIKSYLPEVYEALARQVDSEYNRHACRRNSISDLERALKPRNLELDSIQSNSSLDLEASTTYEE